MEGGSIEVFDRRSDDLERGVILDQLLIDLVVGFV
jgi:hypothetical protein